MLELRPLLAAELALILPIEQAAHPLPWSEGQLASCFGERYVNGLALLDGEPVGFYLADYLLEESTLMNVCVLPERQGAGIGRALMGHYLQQTARRGCQLWWLEVRASNTRAQGLYRALGYQEVGRRKGYYRAADGAEDAIVMQRPA